jgi:hypothetical protein
VIHALTRIKSYLDYGTFQPIQIAASPPYADLKTVSGKLSTLTEAAVTHCATV